MFYLLCLALYGRAGEVAVTMSTRSMIMCEATVPYKVRTNHLIGSHRALTDLVDLNGL